MEYFIYFNRYKTFKMKRKWNSEEASASTYLPSLEATTSHKYDVFLSFRGADTRNTFTSHLYKDLDRVGISVFKDDVEIDKGEDINEALKTAINDSRICIPIFSKDYASSKACLQELSQMVLEDKIIIPIFYDVAADDVKLKTDLYKNALEQHQQKGTVGKEEVESWKKALLKVGKILGYSIMNKV